MRAIHEIRTKEPLCEEYVGAHRDASILNGTIVCEMPDVEVKSELWINKSKLDKEGISWMEVPNHKVYFVFSDESRRASSCRRVLFLGDLSSRNVAGNFQI